MATYRKDTVSRLLSKKGYSIHLSYIEGKKSSGSTYTLLDPEGRIVREKIRGLDSVLMTYAKTIKESFYSLFEEMKSLPPPALTPAEIIARQKQAQKRKEKKAGQLYPLVPCPSCHQIRHLKDSSNDSYKCLSCELKFQRTIARAVSPMTPNYADLTKVKGGRRRIEDGRPVCLNCGQDTLIRAGLKKNKTLRVFKCKACSTKVEISTTDLLN